MAGSVQIYISQVVIHDQESDLVLQNLQFSQKNAEKRIYTKQTMVAPKGVCYEETPKSFTKIRRKWGKWTV